MSPRLSFCGIFSEGLFWKRRKMWVSVHADKNCWSHYVLCRAAVGLNCQFSRNLYFNKFIPLTNRCREFKLKKKILQRLPLEVFEQYY